MSAPSALSTRFARWLPHLLCAAAVVACTAMMDLKGITTDEGFRLWLINGGHHLVPGSAPTATWNQVLTAVNPFAYQPAYYLFQNTLMRVAERQDLAFFRSVNLVFFALCLWGLLRLSRSWAVWPRAFLVGLFAFNAYLFMHVLQIREYIVALAFYIWSTQLVLALDRRTLEREWADIGCFLGYGLLLGAAFYVQTWIVFPAIGQGVFLLFRRRTQFWRFGAHLAICYLLVFSLTWPYLRTHSQKINVGLWERAHVTLSGQLYQGFKLVLSGHPPGHDWFTALLPVAWLALLFGAAGLILRRRPQLPADFTAECTRQSWLMILCGALPLAFQIAYYFKVEPLSVWPRYFIVHYFYLTWLIALAFRTIHTARDTGLRPARRRAVLVGASALLVVSGLYQLRSFHRDPYFDTSLSPGSDWRVGTAALAPLLRPGDVLFSTDFITRATITFTRRTTPSPVLLEDLAHTDTTPIKRLVYLEQDLHRSSTPEHIAQLRQLGFGQVQVSDLPAPDGSGPLPQWRVLVFTRE